MGAVRLGVARSGTAGGGSPGGGLRTPMFIGAAVPGGPAAAPALGHDDESAGTGHPGIASAAASDGDVPGRCELSVPALRGFLEAQQRATQCHPVQPVDVAAVVRPRAPHPTPKAVPPGASGQGVLEGARVMRVRGMILASLPVARAAAEGYDTLRGHRYPCPVLERSIHGTLYLRTTPRNDGGAAP